MKPSLPQLELRLEHVHPDPDIRCPDCNGPCVTDCEIWETKCTDCNWSTQYQDPEEAFLLDVPSVEFMLHFDEVTD